MVYRKDFLYEQVGQGTGRSFAHDFAHGVFKVLPAITAVASLINKSGISAKPEEWVNKAVDYLKSRETDRQYIQEDIDVAKPEDFSWKELYAYKKSGFTLPERLSDKLAREMDEETKKYEFQLANPSRITDAERQTKTYADATKAFIAKYTKELNKFLALSDSDFNSQKNNIRLREINITRSNYEIKSKELDDLLAKLRTKLSQVGAGRNSDSESEAATGDDPRTPGYISHLEEILNFSDEEFKEIRGAIQRFVNQARSANMDIDSVRIDELIEQVENRLNS